MLGPELLISFLHRLLGIEIRLSCYCYECSDLGGGRIRDWKVGIIPGFLHPLNRQLETGNPAKHVSITVVQVHELLETVEEHIGCALHEDRPQETLEVLTSAVRVIQAISVKKLCVNRCFTFQTVVQSRSSFIIVQLSDITAVIDLIFISEPIASTVITRRYFVILEDDGDSSHMILPRRRQSSSPSPCSYSTAKWRAMALSTDRTPGDFSSGRLHLCEVCRRNSGHIHVCK